MGMNIDLLRTKTGQFGIVCDALLPSIPQAALLDRTKGVLSLEFGPDQDSMECNVSIVEEWRTPMMMEDNIVVGCIVDGVVQTAETVPLRSF